MPSIAATATTLTDIQKHWAKKDIEQLIDLNVIDGYPNNTFDPNGTITKA